MNTVTRSRPPTLDPTCAAAVDLARAAAEDVAGLGQVGEYLGPVADAERVVTHRFACLEPAYRGWSWAVTVARASRGKLVTVDETVLLPGRDAILAPEWVPWSARLRPGDLGAGDILPADPDDDRLAPGYTGADAFPTPVGLADEAGGDGATFVAGGVDDRQLPFVAYELGYGRARVLSREGRIDAAERWHGSTHGPDNPMTRQAPGHCVSCGFRVPLTGALGQLFGVCANEFSPSDGQVIALDHGCGAHSEAAGGPAASPVGRPVIDEFLVEEITWEPSAEALEHGSVETTSPAEDLGHS